MTEKWITDVWCSETGDIGFTYDGVDMTFKGDALETFLNELIEENEQLKQSIDNLMDSDAWWGKKATERVEELEEENEQLKKNVEYWKQVALQYSNELNVNDSTKSRNDKEKICGYCKNYNLDGMFGIWCSIHETPTYDKYCQDFEWNR